MISAKLKSSTVRVFVPDFTIFFLIMRFVCKAKTLQQVVEILVFRKKIKTSGQGYIDKNIVIFEKSSKVSQGENPLQAFLFFAKFSIFVSVEQGEVTFLFFFCFRISVLRVNSGHKIMLSKKEKMKSRAKKL